MHLECHAVLGWSIGLIGGADSRVRRHATLAAVLPDIDAVPYLFGPLAYAQWHHTFGHNVFLLVAYGVFAYVRFKSIRAALLIALAFGSHLLTDAYLSGWQLYLFWPFSHAGFLFPGAVGLEHPINLYLIYAGFLVVVILAAIYKRTPIDLVSPAFDRLLVSAFTPRRLRCGACGRKANQHCASCGEAVCWLHAIVRKSYAVVCAKCGKADR